MATSYNEAKLYWGRFNQAINTTLNAEFPLARAAIELAAIPRPDLSPEEMSCRDFEQFIIGTVMLHRAFIAGEISEMGDWIQWALTDEPTDDFKHEMFVGRVATFYMNPVIYSWSEFHKIMVCYLSALYEYARRRTAIPDICLYLLPFAFRTFEAAMQQPQQRITREDIQLAAFMLTWMAKEKPDLAPSLALKFEAFATKAQLAKWQRYFFALTLSTSAGAFSSLGTNYWANYALTRLARHASEIDKVQLRATLMRTDEQGAVDAEALIAQMEVARAEKSKLQMPIAIAREAAFSTGQVQPFFVKVLAMKRADLLLRGLQTWYMQGTVTDGPDADRLLISLPFGETSSSYLCGGKLLEIKRGTQDPLVNVSRAMNSFLQTYATVAGADNSDLEIPERPGYPMEFQEGLIEALTDAYCPEGVEVPGNPTAQLILPTDGHPIQATQLLNWGRTWPIASSLARPQRDRTARKALLWGGGDAISAIMELNMVEHALTRAGVQICRPVPEIYTRELFLELYRKDEFDIVWIASHGEFNHWRPHEVQLELARDISSVGLEELWGIAPKTDERRLLVLNVCDGARFSDPGLLPRVGLAPGLATACQATISHLWPVRPYPSAAFGALLAHFISEGQRYFEAYVTALQSLRKPAPDVAADLERLYGGRFDLIERLEMHQSDFSLIETWGSAAFFQ